MSKFDELSAQFIRELRGTQSQRVLSRRLGFKSNVVYHWEAARRHPTLLQVFDMIRLLQPEGDGCVAIEEIDDLESLAAYLRGFAPELGPTEIADMVGHSRHKVSRWLRAESAPKLPEFLEYVEQTRNRTLDWIAGFVDPGRLEAAAEDWKRLDRVRSIAMAIPISMAVINVVDLQAYRDLPRHEPGWIARRLGLTLPEERHILESLESVGLMERGETHWSPNLEQVDLLQGPVEYWGERCLEDPRSPRFFVASMSPAAREELNELTRRYWQAVGQILKTDRHPDQVVAMSILRTRIDRFADT